MRVIRDGFGDIRRTDGTTLHTGVRFLVDDQRRVAVFPSTRTASAPTTVYTGTEVEYTIERRPCACKGDAPKMTLTRMWINSERQAAGV